MIPPAPASLFEEHQAAWRAWQQSPWGRIRYRVVSETLRRTCAAVGHGKLRVLDVGGGDGADAIPLAAAGHEVTILDYSEPLLAQAHEQANATDRAGLLAGRLTTVCATLDELTELRLGQFDVVLCHNVLHYREDISADISILTAAVAPSGALSVMAPNPATEVLTSVVRHQDPAAAIRLLTETHVHTDTFDHDVRRIEPSRARAALQAHAFPRITQYGIRCVTDLLVADERKHEPDFYADLERLELQLCDREPFVGTARLWQLVAQR